jgi:hypothetical protein
MKLFKTDNGIAYYELSRQEIEVFHYFKDILMKNERDIDIDDAIQLEDDKMYIFVDTEYKTIESLISEVFQEIPSDSKYKHWMRNYKLKKIKANLV